ncbi:hypothetical protein DPEC_G00169360 [Dallia pectoralis]|uniref:Uncharacterized protein n=1 Tax=Dallia pectoralis TaxID=75939 RepID=A0ACC2GCI9_DALPE|nr:hypothetical protein DPEC_G00169360 [Dallia pectoralis]
MNLTQDQLSSHLSFTPRLQVESATQSRPNASSNLYDPHLHTDSLLRPSPRLPSSAPVSPSSLLPADDFELAGLIWRVHEPTTVALTFMYCLSFLVGFIGNVMSIKVLTNRRSERLAAVSATRCLLVNLAVCDLAVVCVCMPITLGNQIYAVWIYGDFLCRAVPFTQATSVSASVLTLTVISINRYYSVRCPLRARSLFTRCRILATVGVVWAASLVICAPLVFMNRRDEISLGASFAIPVCQEVWPGPRLKQGYTVLLFVALYCVPVTFNLTIGFLTGRGLWGDGNRGFLELDPRSRALHSSRLKTRKKIAKMVVALVLLFAVSWLPLYVTEFWMDRVLHPPQWLMLTRPFALWLGLTNSSLNPICYCFIGDLHRGAKVFRTHYHRRLAALFSASFTDAGTGATPAAEEGDTAVTVDVSMATVPKLQNLSRDRGVWTTGGSDNSLSDWLKSTPSECERSPLPCLLNTLQTHAPRTAVCKHRLDGAPLNCNTGAPQETRPLRRPCVEHGGTDILKPLLSVDRRDTLPLMPTFGNTLDTQNCHIPLRRVSDTFILRNYSGDGEMDTSPFCGCEKTGGNISSLRRDPGDIILDHVTSL